MAEDFKLGEMISSMKEDFTMVHLEHSCSQCCILMVPGTRWVCKQCESFQLCDKCCDTERKREDRERHPMNQKDKHTLYPVEITGVPDDTKDNGILDSELNEQRKLFELLAHASECRSARCEYPNCRKLKGLFQHGVICKVGASGDCTLCKKMWYLLQLHARACKGSECNIPRCRELKELIRTT